MTTDIRATALHFHTRKALAAIPAAQKVSSSGRGGHLERPEGDKAESWQTNRWAENRAPFCTPPAFLECRGPCRGPYLYRLIHQGPSALSVRNCKAVQSLHVTVSKMREFGVRESSDAKGVLLCRGSGGRGAQYIILP